MATTTEFKSSVELQSKTASVTAITSSLPGTTSNPNETRYWAEKFGLGPAKINPDAKFSHYRQVTLQAGTAAVVHQLVFGPSDSKFVPMATVCGPRVQLYGTQATSSIHRLLSQHSLDNRQERTAEHDRQIATGGHLSLGAAFRNDGRLLAIATDNGQIRVSDTTSRATLCTWQNPTRLAVRSVRWFRNGQSVLAAGDDGVLTIWHLQQKDRPAISCRGHGDAVRCADLWQLPEKNKKQWPISAIAATGSYDHTVRLWQMDHLDSAQEDRCLAVLSHGSPVEAVLWVRSSDPKVPVWLLSAGGTVVKVWNPLSGRCVSTTNTQHRKTITALLAMPRKDYTTNGVALYSRILTGSLDGILRVHSWDDKTGQLQHLHSIDLKVPITSLAATPNADRIAIGTTDGRVFVRQRGPNISQQKRKLSTKAGTYAYFTRGMNVDASAEDYVVAAVGKKRKLNKFDTALKQFRYGDALDESLATRNPQSVVAVLEELGKRRGLAIALSNRDEESLEPILSFTVRYITRPRFSALLIGVAHKLIDIYGNIGGESEMIDELFVKLKEQVSTEYKAQMLLLRVVGQLDAIMAATQLDEEQELV